MHRRRIALLAAWITVATMTGLAAQGLVPPNPASGIERARELLSSLGGAANHTRYAQVGRELGHVIDAFRSGDATMAQLATMRGLTEQLHQRTDQHLKSLESATGRDEAALETLYSSSAWDDLSFALAAFPYWGAWLDLQMSQQSDKAASKKKWLWAAKKGFRGTAVQVFRPSLVYGGWLGLGYVAIAEEEQERAVKIFESLQRALGEDSDNPLLEVVALELRILRAKSGDVVATPIGSEINDTEVQLLRSEAVTLFEHSKQAAHNKRARRAREESAAAAVDRLRHLIDSGNIDRELIAIVVHYHEKIVGDLGVLTPLVRAERAFAYGHDTIAIGQYEKHFEFANKRAQLVPEDMRFRYALSLLNAGSFHSAATNAERVLKGKNLDAQTQRAATKLAYVARVSRKANHTPASREALRKSAERLIRVYPDDKDADAARLTIAQTTTSSKKAHAMLNAIEAPKEMQASVRQTQFFLIARDFADAIKRADSKLAAQAKNGIAAYKRLPKKQRELSENLALSLQMRALADPDPHAVSEAINEAEELEQLNPDSQSGILWARLECLKRIDDETTFIAFLRKLASAPLESWHLQQLYPLIKSNPEPPQRLRAAEALLTGSIADVSMARRFEAIVIEAMLSLEQNAEAYDRAKQFRTRYPKLGDAYRLVALSAAKTNRPFEADKAWRAITDKSDPRRPIWWEGMLHRVRIRGQSTRPQSACAVLLDIDAKSEFMPVELQSEIDDWRGTLNCGKSEATATDFT